jgi:methionine-rich copper-binding protein CopC
LIERPALARLLLAAAACLVGIAGAAAHAFLSQAAPPVGVVVAAAPREIRITFSEAIEPAFSAIELATAEGTPVSTGRAAVDPGNSTQLVLPLPPLAPGRYRVSWHVVSVDTHRTEGQYGFEIRP